MQPKTWIVLSAVAIVACVACRRSEMRYLSRSVSVSELPGRWVMTAQAATDLLDVGVPGPVDAARHTITLAADGKCTYRSYVLVSPSPERARHVEASCRWSLASVGHQALVLTFPGNKRRHFYFDEDPAHGLLLWNHVGDPDAWRYVEYSRQQS